MPWLWPLTAIQPCFGEEVGHGEAADQRHAGGGDDQQRQDRAAVDDQQDQQDDAERGEQQQPVDAGEALGEVGEDRARAGDVGGGARRCRAARAGRRSPRAARHRGRGRTAGPPAAPRRPRDGISGEASPSSAPASSATATASSTRPCASARPPVAASASLSHSRITGSAALGVEPPLQFGDPGRLGAVGQERRRVVLLDLAQLAAERAEGAGAPSQTSAMMAGRSQRTTDVRRGMISLDGR